MTQDLELRVLTGLHHGARCPAQDGALLGSHERCDIVLCDEGIAEEAVRLWIGNEAWRLSTHDDMPDSAQELPFGAPYRLGPIHVTVACAGDSWPTPDELSAMLRSAEESQGDSGRGMHDSDAAGMTSASATEEGGTAIATPRHPDQNLPLEEGAYHLEAGRAQRKKSRLRWAFGGLLILLVFGGAASYSPAGVQPDAQLASAPLADAETLTRTQQLLRNRGYADRLHAALSSEQQIVVSGWVRDNKDHDELATVLTEIWPLPTLQVDDQGQATARIMAQSLDLDVRVVVEYPSPGHLTIRGIAASDTARTQALERWQANVDASPQVTITLLPAEQVRAALNKAISAAGLPTVTTDWKDKTLWVGARGFDARQLQRLKGILDALNSSYVNTLQVGEDESPKSVPIPFRVHSVVGGTQPWIMLEDGTRIIVGGTHGAYSLKSIEDGRVVFDGPSTAVIAR
jgi:type III secretion protein D